MILNIGSGPAVSILRKMRGFRLKHVDDYILLNCLHTLSLPLIPVLLVCTGRYLSSGQMDCSTQPGGQCILTFALFFLITGRRSLSYVPTVVVIIRPHLPRIPHGVGNHTLLERLTYLFRQHCRESVWHRTLSFSVLSKRNDNLLHFHKRSPSIAIIMLL